MNYRISVLLVIYCAIMCGKEVALAAKEGKSAEVAEDHEMKSNNETSAEVGLPDSHEAMNNRDVSSKMREKRSYEFLMGLINNNSKYEVTRVDPSSITQKPKDTQDTIAASELLLELMVRIAAHPDQWDRVHQLLQKIDEDLTTSKHLADKLNKEKVDVDASSKNILVNKKELGDQDNESSSNFVTEKIPNLETTTQVLLSSNEQQKLFSESTTMTNKWPSFKYEGEPSKVNFVNNDHISTTKEESEVTDRYSWRAQNKPVNKAPFQKNFAYHRVTGKPFYLKKNPKAYIAVSVIAPKSADIHSREEDLALENELRQLKPWTHQQNLKNMESIRSRWIIQTEDKTESIAP